ncbi:PIN domain protein [uncultured archaeon]|nr:PIN domain protein [uncultured archaeon]
MDDKETLAIQRGMKMTSSKSVELLHFKNSEWDYFKEYFADFDRYWTEVSKRLGKGFIDYMRCYLQKNQFIFSERCSFSVEFVVDSNIIFSEVRAIMKGKISFLASIINSPFLKLFAPPEIIKEVTETIEKDLPKGLNKDKAKEIAQGILSNIVIIDGQRLDAWIKAYTLIGKRDKKDVPFLNLAFSLETHGIITNDNDFSEQEEVKIWKLGKVGKMISDFSKGSVSLFFLGIGSQSIFKLCYLVIISFLKLLVEIIEILIYSVGAIISGSMDALSRIPLWVWALAMGSIAAVLILSKEVREKVGDVLAKLGEKAVEFIGKIKESFSRILAGIKQVIEILMPFISFVLKATGYLFYSASYLVTRMCELEKERTKV